MPITHQILLSVIFVSTFIFATATIANAQGAVKYVFLEVVDYANKPIADATVNVQGADGGDKQTNQKGQLEKGFPIGLGDEQTYGFTVSKSGYYPFEDLGLFRSPFSQYGDKFIIELLKIPTNNVERKILGNEQRKRKLFWAIRKGETETVRKLLNSDINPYISTDDLRGIPGPGGVPAIIYAAAQADIETVKEFLAAGVNLRKKNPATREILSYYLRADPFFVRYPQTDDEKAKRIISYEKGIDTLIEAGADLNTKYKSLITIASEKGNTKIIGKLLSKGVSVNSKNQYGTTALMEMVKYPYQMSPSQLGVISFLLKSGANPNIVAGDNSNGDESYCETTLINAAEAGQHDIVKLLLRYTADAKFKCKSGKNALTAALQKRDFELVKILVDAGANVNSSGQYGTTPLMIAVLTNNLPLIKMLLANGALINTTDKPGRTALIYAASGFSETPNFEVVDLLLKSGANPNVMTNDFGEYTRCNTALTGAARRGSIEIIQLLLANKADVNLTCENGDTPIVHAVKTGRIDAVKLLIEAGADLKGVQGQRALQFAKEKLKDEKERSNFEEMIKLLEAAGAKY